MDRADARAGEHGDGGFGDHRHIDRDAVAFFGTLCFQHIGKAADVGVEFAVGDFFGIVRVVTFPDDGHLIGAVFQMPVEAIGRYIERAVLVPFDGKIFGIKARVFHFGEGRDPVDALGFFTPECVGVFDAGAIERVVARLVDDGAGLPVVRYGKEFV